MRSALNSQRRAGGDLRNGGMQSMWNGEAAGSFTLDLNPAPEQPAGGGLHRRSPSVGSITSASFESGDHRPSSFASCEVANAPDAAYPGPCVVPHHHSSVRCVAHNFIRDSDRANALLGMESGEIIVLVEKEDATGTKSLFTEKLGHHRASITALLVFRETLISADKQGFICLWDLREEAPVRLRCTLRAPAAVNAMAVQSLEDVLSTSSTKFSCPPSSILASCLPDALLFSGEDDVCALPHGHTPASPQPQPEKTAHRQTAHGHTHDRTATQPHTSPSPSATRAARAPPQLAGAAARPMWPTAATPLARRAPSRSGR